MRSSNYINKFHIKTQTIFKNNIYTKITANRKWYPCQQCFTPLYGNTTTVHNYNEQLHPKVRIFKDNSCYFVVDIVSPLFYTQLIIHIYTFCKQMAKLKIMCFSKQCVEH